MKKYFIWIICILLNANSFAVSSVDDYGHNNYFLQSLTDAERVWIEKGETLTYVYDPDWAPFEWKSEQGVHTGIIADLFALLRTKTALKIEPENTDTWTESVALVKEKKADMFSAITVTEERKQYLDFTKKDIYSYPAVLVTQFDDSDVYLELEKDAHLKTIAIVKDSGLGLYIQQTHPGLKFLIVPSTQAGFTAVLNGSADLFAINAITARYYIEKHYLDEIKIATKLNYIYNLKIAVHKDNPPEVASILDKALGAISDSEQNAIFNRWTHIDNQSGIDWVNLIRASFVFLIILAFLAWHNIKLKKLVNQKTRELSDLANSDSLTGVNNRRKLDMDFSHEKKRANRNNHKMALFFLDLNNFKIINDNYGHQFGDLVLKTVASKVTKALRDSEKLYRVGGDEFCILLPEITTKDQILQVAGRVKEVVADISSVDKKMLEIGCIIGISIYPDDGEIIDTLMTAADQDMYRDKVVNQ